MLGKMKLLVQLPLLVCMVCADLSKIQDGKTKPQAISNSITSIPKQEQQYYQVQYQPIQIQPQLQHQAIQVQTALPVHGQIQGQNGQTQYVQIIPKPVYVSQQQPAMIIIAQPAYLPANLVYGGAMQQLLNYFHSNPQARYHLLHGNQPQYAQPKYMPQPIVNAVPITNYQVVTPTQYQHPGASTAAQYQSQLPTVSPAQYHAQSSAMIASQIPTSASATHEVNSQKSTLQSTQATHYSSQRNPQSQPQPMQLTQLARVAQLAAQQYLNSPTKTSPAIITGFENFTPEQQAQIKSQLNAHFGQINDISPNQYSQVATAAKTQYPIQYSRYQTQTVNDFVPSQQVKSEPSAPGLVSTNASKSKM